MGKLKNLLSKITQNKKEEKIEVDKEITLEAGRQDGLAKDESIQVVNKVNEEVQEQTPEEFEKERVEKGDVAKEDRVKEEITPTEEVATIESFDALNSELISDENSQKVESPTSLETVVKVEETQVKTGANIDIGKSSIVVKNPINYSLEKIANDFKISGKHSLLMEQLKAIAAKSGVTLKDVSDMLELVIFEVKKNEIELSKENKLSEQKAEVNEEISVLESFKLQMEELINSEVDTSEYTYETYLDSVNITKLQNANKIIEQVKEVFMLFNFSENYKTEFGNFIEHFSSINSRSDALAVKINEIKRLEEVLKGEIKQFTLALSKVKAPNGAVADQYFSQMKDAQKELNDKRDEYIKIEKELNSYISVVNISLNDSFGTLATFSKPLIIELEKYIEEIRKENAELFETEDSEAKIKMINGDIKELGGLKAELESCKKLHSMFETL